MKKFSILCCAVVMLTALAGCSSNTTSSETKTSSQGTVSSSIESMADDVSSAVSEDSSADTEASSEVESTGTNTGTTEVADFIPVFPADTTQSTMNCTDTCITVSGIEDGYILQLNFLFPDKESAPSNCATVLFPTSDISLETMHLTSGVPCELTEYIEGDGYYMVYLDPAVAAPGYDTYDGIEDYAEFMVAMYNADAALDEGGETSGDVSSSYADTEAPSAQGTISSGEYTLSSVSFDTDYAGNDALLIQVTTTAPDTEMSVTDIPRPEIEVDFVLTNSDWVAEVTNGASMMVGTHVTFDYYIEKPGVFETVTISVGDASETFAFEDFQ